MAWYKQKTTWTALAGLVTAWGAYFADGADLGTALAASFAAFSVIFLRQGVAKVGVFLFAAMLVIGCAGTPANTSPSVQGANTLTGQQGQAQETGSATTYANPIILNFFGKRLTLKASPSGEVTVEGEGDDEGAVINGNLTTGSVTYGEDSATSSVSSGGGSAAGVSGSPTNTKTVLPPEPPK